MGVRKAKVAPWRGRNMRTLHEGACKVPAARCGGIGDIPLVAGCLAISVGVKRPIWHHGHVETQAVQLGYEVVASGFESQSSLLIACQRIRLEAGEGGVLAEGIGEDEEVLCQALDHRNQGRGEYQPSQTPAGHAEVL